MTDMSKDTPHDDADGGNDVVRQQSWPCDGAAEIEIAIELGQVRVDLVAAGPDDTDAREVRVEVRHDPDTGGGIQQGVRGFMNWVSSASASWSGSTGFAGFDPGSWDVSPWESGGSWDGARFAAEAVRAAEISWSEAGRRLVVRSAPDMPLRLVPLAVTVTAPQGARLAARTGAGDVTVTGRAGWTALRTGPGRVRAGDVDGDLDVTTGSGDVTIGDVTGRSRVRTGSGDITIAAATGPADVKAGSGDVTLGKLDGDLGVRTGSGVVRVADAVAGRIDVTTGTGDVIIGVHPEVLAEVDLSTGTGSARSDLPVLTTQPAGPATLHLRGRTGTGDVLIRRAALAPPS